MCGKGLPQHPSSSACREAYITTFPLVVAQALGLYKATLTCVIGHLVKDWSKDSFPSNTQRPPNQPIIQDETPNARILGFSQGSYSLHALVVLFEVLRTEDDKWPKIKCYLEALSRFSRSILPPSISSRFFFEASGFAVCILKSPSPCSL